MKQNVFLSIFKNETVKKVAKYFSLFSLIVLRRVKKDSGTNFASDLRRR